MLMTDNISFSYLTHVLLNRINLVKNSFFPPDKFNVDIFKRFVYINLLIFYLPVVLIKNNEINIWEIYVLIEVNDAI